VKTNRQSRVGSGEVPLWLVIVGAAVCLPLLFGGCYAVSNVKTSDGYRDSTVRKLSETGVIWKTHEVETLGDGVRLKTDGSSQVSPETFTYTVRDPAVLEQLRALPPGRRVRVHYEKYLIPWPSRGETSYFITRIEHLPE